ncbi:hypothetical protein C8R46DRAFT_1103605 [Mycena filopes]|nr:hypothetical protein C8R46DRAFT_1103605 [Mycena filopes]
MRFSLTTIATGLLIAGVNVAFAAPADSSGLSDSQLCTLNCSTNAVTDSKCDINNTTCLCQSSVYTTSLTTCATTTCKLSSSDVKGLLASGCPNGSAAPTSSPSGATELNAGRLGAAAASVVGLISYALLM